MWILTLSHYGNDEQPALFWKQFLEDDEGEFNHLLGALSSLILTPPAGDTTSPVTFYHKSLSDFLSSKVRCGDLYVRRSAVDTFAGDRCIGVLRRKGPRIPLRDQVDLVNFLRIFRRMPLVRLAYRPEDHPSQKFTQFLRFTTSTSRHDLTLCDVPWWTCLLVRGLIDRPTEPTPYINTLNMPLLAGIYCKIHIELCRSRSSYASVGCHEACLHWRMGILAEAKALGWCVHELERVDVDQLPKITVQEFEDKFRKMGRILDGSSRTCRKCQPIVAKQQAGRILTYGQNKRRV